MVDFGEENLLNRCIIQPQSRSTSLTPNSGVKYNLNKDTNTNTDLQKVSILKMICKLIEMVSILVRVF